MKPGLLRGLELAMPDSRDQDGNHHSKTPNASHEALFKPGISIRDRTLQNIIARIGGAYPAAEISGCL